MAVVRRGKRCGATRQATGRGRKREGEPRGNEEKTGHWQGFGFDGGG